MAAAESRPRWPCPTASAIPPGGFAWGDVAALAQLDLERADNAQLIEATISNERFRNLALKEGETLVVRPKRLHVFVDGGASI